MVSIIFLITFQVGLATYGIQNSSFPCKEIPRKSVLSIVWGDFGYSKHCLYDASPSTLLIHLTNETCRKEPYRCGSRAFLPTTRVAQYNKLLHRLPRTLKTRLIRRLKAISTLKNRLGGTIILSLGLEDQFDTRAVRNLYSFVKEHWPYEISRNPLKSSYSPADYIEFHSLQPKSTKACIFSNDGRDICPGIQGRECFRGSLSLQEARRYFRRMRYCSLRFVHYREFNCLRREGDRSIDPARRVCTKDTRLIRSLIANAKKIN